MKKSFLIILPLAIAILLGCVFYSGYISYNAEAVIELQEEKDETAFLFPYTLFCKDTAAYPREACTKPTKCVFKYGDAEEEFVPAALDVSKFEPIAHYKRGDVIKRHRGNLGFACAKWITTDYEPTGTLDGSVCVGKRTASPSVVVYKAGQGQFKSGICQNQTGAEEMVTFDENNNLISSFNLGDISGYRLDEETILGKDVKVLVMEKYFGNAFFGTSGYIYFEEELRRRYFFFKKGKPIFELNVSWKQHPDKDGQEHFVFEEVVWSKGLNCPGCEANNIFLVRRTDQLASYEDTCTNSEKRKLLNGKESLCPPSDSYMLGEPKRMSRNTEISAVYKYDGKKIKQIWKPSDGQRKLKRLAITIPEE